MNRRNFLQVFGASSALASFTATASNRTTAKKTLSIAGYDYDRLMALSNQEIELKGYDYTYAIDSIGNMNTSTFSGAQPYDVTEVGLHPYILAQANQGFSDYTLLPIFPLRAFRHKSIFIRTDRNIHSAADLKGRKVGTPGFSSTSLTWIRGILKDEYGINPEDIHWVIPESDSSAGVAGKASEQERVIPEHFKVTQGSPGKDESTLLEDGEVDALLHAAEPRCFIQGHPKVARLFSDPKVTESAYFKKTGIFPIMHAIAIRRSLVEQDQGIIPSVFAAYVEAKKKAQQRLMKQGWADSMLPWISQEIRDTNTLLGSDYWSYGIESNRKEIETLLEYSFDQKLSQKLLTTEEIFHPASLALSE